MTEFEHQEINLTEFKALLKKSGNIYNKRIVGVGNIKNQVYGEKRIVNCIFDCKLSFTEIQFYGELEFDNCESKYEMEFYKCIFSDEFIISNCNFTSELKLFDPTFSFFKIIEGDYNKISIGGIVKSFEGKEGEIIFSSGTFDEIYILGKDVECSFHFLASKIKQLSFTKTKIRNSIKFDENVEIKYLYTESSDFYDRLDFFNCSLQENTYLHKSNFYEQIIFSNGCMNDSLTFANVYVKHNVSLNYENNLNSLTISDCRFDSNFSCYSYNKEVAYSGNGIMFYLSGVIHGNLIFEGVPIPHLSLGAMNFGNLMFNKIKTKLIFMQEFYNYNKLTINNIILNEKYNLLLIYDSNINDTEFININFKKFNEVVVAKSNVSNFLLTNSLFPNRIQTETKAPQLGFRIESHEKINDHLYYRETYRQLKKAMENQGNRNQALIYKSKEMYYLRKELKFGWDKLLLYLNFISNNHGVSWLRGIVFTVTMSFLFFCLYNETLTEKIFYWSLNISINEIQSTFNFSLNYFVSFIASFPKLRLDDNSNIWQTNLIVLLSRIFIGYGIYQTIVAFRKYGNK